MTLINPALSWEELVASLGEAKARAQLRQWEAVCALSKDLAAMTAPEDRWDLVRRVAAEPNKMASHQ